MLVSEPDHHIAPYLSTAVAPKCLRALERLSTVISADMVLSKHGRWLRVCDSDIKVVQTLVCKDKSKNPDVREELILLSIQLAKNTRTICGITLLKCGYSLNITYSEPAGMSMGSCYCIACTLLRVLCSLYPAESSGVCHRTLGE